MNRYTPKTPKIKYLTPKIRPSSFSLDEKDKSDSFGEFEIDNVNKYFENNFEQNDNEDNSNILNKNSIFNILMKNRRVSNSSIETKDSESFL